MEKLAIRQIRYEGDDILRKKCKRVEEVNDHIRMLLDDMLDTLHNTKDGAAIAAPPLPAEPAAGQPAGFAAARGCRPPATPRAL